jgi:hypothetical protein
VMITAIQIDAGLNDDLFSLEPPEGYTLSLEGPKWPDYKKKIMAKVMRLGLWCAIYAGNNDNQFPDALTDLVASGVTTDDALIKVLASPDDSNGSPVIEYRKPNTESKDRSNQVILYETCNRWSDDGFVVGFADGHSELIHDRRRFEELMK